MDPPTQPPTAATRPAIAGSPTTGGIPALFARAIGRPHALRRCIVLLTGLGAAYALSIELLALGGGTPGTAPWLAIPTESYFFVEPAFTAPVIVLGAILASPVAYLLATAFGSRGTFDDTLVAVGLATCIATLFSLVPDFVMGLITAAGLADGASWAEDLLRPSLARTPLTPLQPRIRVVGSPVPRDADSRHPGNGRQSGSPTRAVAVAGINRLRRWAARDVGHPHPGHRAADAVRPDQPFRPPLRRQRRRGPAGSPPAAVRVAPSPPGDDGARPSEKLARLADVTGADVDPPDRAADHERTPTAGRRHGPGRGRGMRQRRPGAGTGRTGAASPPGPAPADTPPAGAPAAVAHCVTRRPTKPRSGSGGTHPSMAPRGLFSTGTSGTS